jgi:osmotically inducible protein OsmC
MPLDKVLYTAKTHTIGGRDGASHTDDGRLAVKPSSPGTPGSGTNPEQPRNRTGVGGPRA